MLSPSVKEQRYWDRVTEIIESVTLNIKEATQ
jgi:hypothetical protein